MSEPLVLWTIYDHPFDYPDSFVARRWLVGADIKATDRILASNTLDWLREQMEDMGLACITRSEGDDPDIVETWL
jgi:hypothetical protein